MRGAEAVHGQWRCTASAAQSDRPNAAICNGIVWPELWALLSVARHARSRGAQASSSLYRSTGVV